MNDTLALTRYLYDKTKVFKLLQIAIDEKQYEESLFWAYELYYSWLEIETIDYVINIAQSKLPGYKRFHRFLLKKKTEWLSKEIHEKPHSIVATILKNIFIRDPMSEENNMQQIYVVISIKDIEPYQTMCISPVYKTLPTLCRYWLTIPDNPSEITEEQRMIINNVFENWLFYASRIPLWEHRILQYRGNINIEKSTVTFENESLMEDFFDKYGFEPDEQSIEIKRRLLGI
jgi:hypothetical protein